MSSANTTTPAPQFESPAWIPASAKLTPLAMAALEANVSPADVQAYLSARYSVRVFSVEQVSL